MKITRTNSIILILTFIITWYHTVFPSVFEGTLVSTPKGLIPIEKLKAGDTVISCSTNGKLLEVPIKNIGIHSQGIVYRFFTEPLNKLEDAKYICAPAFQELYDPFLKQWIKAEKVTTNNWLMTHELGVVPIEQIQWEQKMCREYHIELDSPHVFFISNCSYSPKISQHFHQLILVYNFIPTGTAIPGVFGTSLASMPFSEIGVVLLKAAENAHPVVKTVVGLATAGAFLYEMFKPDDAKHEPVKVETPQNKIWVLNNMPQSEGNQPAQKSNTSTPPQQPNPNNQNNKQNQKPTIIANEHELRNSLSRKHDHIFGQKRAPDHRKAQQKGQLPQSGPFKVSEQKFGHQLGAAGAVVNGKPQVATAYHVKTCCP